MDSPITIEALRLEGFRAYLQPQKVQLSRGKTPLSLAVFAPNARGKSSLIDAFEYYCSDDATLERLGKRTAQTGAGPVALEHVAAKEAGVTPSVHFWFRHGRDRFDAARPVSTNPPPLPEAAARLCAHQKVPFIIRGYELRQFVEKTTPEARYREMASWFSLDPLLTMQKSLRQLRRQTKESAEDSAQADERLRDLRRLTDGEISKWDESEICKWYSSVVLSHLDSSLELATLSTADPTYAEVAKRKAAEEEQLGLSALRRFQAQVGELHVPPDEDGQSATGLLPAFLNAVAAHAAAAEQESAERSKAADAVFSAVWKQAKVVLDDPANAIEACPVCDTPFMACPHGSRGAVTTALGTKLGALGAYDAAQKDLVKAAHLLDDATTEFKAGLQGLVTALADTSYAEASAALSDYASQLGAFRNGAEPPAAEQAIRATTALHSTLESEIHRIQSQQGEHTYSNAAKVAEDLHRLRSDLVRIHQTKAHVRSLIEELNRQALFINKAITDHTQGLIGELQSDVSTLYRGMQGEEADVPPIRFELPGEDETNQQRIHLVVDFTENRKGVLPTGYLSDSQIHTLALALRLAAARQFNPCLPLLVLDDVVTSYDIDHRKNIASVLASHLAEFQIIIVTHDEQFFSLLQDHLPTSRWVFRRITEIDPEYGPRFHDHRTPDELIQGKLDAGESAAVHMRQAEEEWLLDICRGFGTKVVIRQIDRSYQYDRSELADALASFLKDAGLLPPAVEGISNTFLSSLQKGVVENFATHFSDNPNKIPALGDEKARWKEFMQFRSQFTCTNCGRSRFKRPVALKKPVCKYCETPFSFPTGDSAE